MLSQCSPLHLLMIQSLCRFQQLTSAEQLVSMHHLYEQQGDAVRNFNSCRLNPDTVKNPFSVASAQSRF